MISGFRCGERSKGIIIVLRLQMLLRSIQKNSLFIECVNFPEILGVQEDHNFEISKSKLRETQDPLLKKYKISGSGLTVPA
jgi:hypothetical protein